VHHSILPAIHNVAGARLAQRMGVQARRIAPSPSDQLANVLSIVASHLGLVLFWIASAYWPLLVIASPLACLLHQKAMSEWMHEAAHWNVLAPRRWNDRVVQWLVCVLLFEEIADHRRNHFRHHATDAFFSEGDPDTELIAVRTRRDWRRGIWRDLFFITALSALRSRNAIPNPAHARARSRAVMFSCVLYVAVFALIAALTSVWYAVPIYLVSFATLYPLFNRLRVYSQHIAIDGTGSVAIGSRASRTIVGGPLERFFFASKVMQYHHEHHRSPALPFRQLAQTCRVHDDLNQHARSRLAILAAAYRGLPP
jgi:fatty acid desaturase